MLKRYFAIRIFVMLDIVGLTLYFLSLINGGWPFMHTHAEIAAFLFGALSLQLAVLFVISVGQRLFLIHRKHVHDQWMYEQQQEIKLEQSRSLPLSSLTPVENDDDVLRLSNQSTSSGHYLDMSKRPKVSRLDRIKKLTAIMS